MGDLACHLDGGRGGLAVRWRCGRGGRAEEGRGPPRSDRGRIECDLRRQASGISGRPRQGHGLRGRVHARRDGRHAVAGAPPARQARTRDGPILGQQRQPHPAGRHPVFQPAWLRRPLPPPGGQQHGHRLQRIERIPGLDRRGIPGVPPRRPRAGRVPPNRHRSRSFWRHIPRP